MRAIPKSKKGGVVTATVLGVVGLIIAVIVGLIIIDTLLGANLLTDTTNETDANIGPWNPNITAQYLSRNFTSGIDNISEKIPTILLIVAVVFLFGALVLLVANAKRMGVGGGGSL